MFLSSWSGIISKIVLPISFKIFKKRTVHIIEYFKYIFSKSLFDESNSQYLNVFSANCALFHNTHKHNILNKSWKMNVIKNKLRKQHTRKAPKKEGAYVTK